MRSFVVFTILEQLYGIDINEVNRILSAQVVTTVPNEPEYVEGVFKYENNVIKILSFRRLLGLDSYTQQLKLLFPKLKQQHVAWLDALKESVREGTPFTQTTDHNACHLGQWINQFSTDDREITMMMKQLSKHHENLHSSAIEVLKIRETSQEDARKWIQENVEELYKDTLSYLSKVEEKAEEVAIYMQRCLILNGENGNIFGVNIDEIKDIIHIDDNKIHKSEEPQGIGEHMLIEGILEYEGKLVTLIKDISLDKVN